MTQNNNFRAIAIYLPQFHPIPENDLWWGKGFTEWTNVVKAKPIFEGQYQPHLPADLGFYDLRLSDARRAQAEMAKKYGIYGFCYYHYWFNGKRLLERPAEDLLESGEPDFPFMFCWANENWSRRWDGSEDTILMKQEYSEEDAIAHCRSLIKYFKDHRYITVDGRPVFAIYKTYIIPEPEKYIEAFRKEAINHGINPYILRFQDHNDSDNKIINWVDATVEFQPQSEMLAKYWEYKKKIRGQRIGLGNRIIDRLQNAFLSSEQKKELQHRSTHYLDYNNYVQFLLNNYSYPKNYKRFPGVTPMWDNTARRGKQAFLLKNATPGKYQQWLTYHVKHFHPYSVDENFIFINAWNEWAEGNHLEPCQKWGRAYLEATKEALQVNLNEE